MLNNSAYRKARLSRDPRFDGRFFVAVKTTSIYCRPICPATPPKEKNVIYYKSAIEAANNGYRPCLRCRPDSAPHSPAWKGVNTTLERAITLINNGALQTGNLEQLSDRLGITSRYLRQLFNKHIGASPKAYASYQQCLFAKQLLHQTSLSITEIALASGFKSIRRFNDCFRKKMELTPTQIRNNKVSNGALAINIYYRPPYNWKAMQRFLEARHIPELEWVSNDSYGRTFNWEGCSGSFTAVHLPQKHSFKVTIELSDISQLKQIIYNIRRILDTDTDINIIEDTLKQHYSQQISIEDGLHLPGTWDLFEAGIRAILGQQISVTAARKLVTVITQELGGAHEGKRLFPTPKSIASSDLSFFKMPASRKQTLHNLARHTLENTQDGNVDQPDNWLPLKGIGPWTVQYAKMRGLSDPDIYLAGDLGIKKVVEKAATQAGSTFNPELAAPWRSYLTFQIWNQL